MELYNMELFSNQLFAATLIKNKDFYTFLNVESFSRFYNSISREFHAES